MPRSQGFVAFFWKLAPSYSEPLSTLDKVHAKLRITNYVLTSGLERNSIPCMKRTHSLVLAQLAAVLLFASSRANSAALPNNLLYASTTATQSYTTSIGPIPISGLTLTLPAASAAYNTAIVTLNMPNLFLRAPASATTIMSAELQIVAPEALGGFVAAIGSIGCDTAKISKSGIKPLTIVLKVPLGPATQPVEAEWATTDNTVTTEFDASISAVLGRE